MPELLSRRRPQPSVRLHEEILRAVRAMAKVAPAVDLNDVAQRVGKDPRTVRHHLQLLVVQKTGIFLDRRKRVFALVEPLRRQVQRVQADAAVADVGLAGLAQVWDNEADDRWNNLL